MFLGLTHETRWSQELHREPQSQGHKVLVIHRAKGLYAAVSNTKGCAYVQAGYSCSVVQGVVQHWH